MNREAHSSQLPVTLPTSPLVIILSGPSGVGKDAVLHRMKRTGYPLKYIVTMTTRPRRPNERDDLDYHFVSIEKFQELIDNNGLLEHANVYGNWYGVPRQEIKQALENGEDVLLKVDIQGAITIKKILPQGVFIFLMPPSMEALLMRLKRRHTESASDLELRLQAAEEEIKQLNLFDYAVVNKWDEVSLAVSDIVAIITAEKHRVCRSKIAL